MDMVVDNMRNDGSDTHNTQYQQHTTDRGVSFVEAAIILPVLLVIAAFGWEVFTYFTVRTSIEAATQHALSKAQVSLALSDRSIDESSGGVEKWEIEVKRLETVGEEFFRNVFGNFGGSDLTITLTHPYTGEGSIEQALNSTPLIVEACATHQFRINFFGSTTICTSLRGLREKFAASSQPQLMDCRGIPITTTDLTPEQYSKLLCPCKGDALAFEDSSGVCQCRLNGAGSSDLINDSSTGNCVCPLPGQEPIIEGEFVRCECRSCTDQLARPGENCSCECVPGATGSAGSCACEEPNYVLGFVDGAATCICNSSDPCSEGEFRNPAAECSCENCPERMKINDSQTACICDSDNICEGSNLTVQGDCSCRCRLTSRWEWIDEGDQDQGCRCKEPFLQTSSGFHCRCDPADCPGALSSNKNREGSDCSCACGQYAQPIDGNPANGCACPANYVEKPGGDPSSCECDESVCTGPLTTNEGQEASGCGCNCVEYAVQIDGVCSCPEGYLEDGGACVCEDNCPEGSSPDPDDGCNCKCDDPDYSLYPPGPGGTCGCHPELITCDAGENLIDTGTSCACSPCFSIPGIDWYQNSYDPMTQSCTCDMAAFETGCHNEFNGSFVQMGSYGCGCSPCFGLRSGFKPHQEGDAAFDVPASCTCSRSSYDNPGTYGGPPPSCDTDFEFDDSKCQCLCTKTISECVTETSTYFTYPDESTCICQCAPGLVAIEIPGEPGFSACGPAACQNPGECDWGGPGIGWIPLGET